jgi:isoleucyl-tRNA synthetase
MPKDEIEEFFILSDLQLEQSETTEAQITKTARQKCSRCWRHRATVGESVAHPELCDRCAEVVTAGAGGAS